MSDSTTTSREPDIIIEDESWKQGFTQIPNVIVCHPSISFGAKVCYAVLLRYAWQDGSCFPGQARMARDMACTVRTVHKYLKELEDGGIVITKQRGLNRTNLYRLPRLIGDPRPPHGEIPK